MAGTFALGALVLATALAVITYALAERYLLDQRVRLATRQTYLDARIARDALQTEPRDPAEVLSGLDLGEQRQAFIHRGGDWFATGITAGPQILPASLRRLVNNGESGRQRFEIGGEPALAVGVSIPAIGASFYEVFILDELDATLTVIRNSLLAAAATTTIAAAALGVWAARRVLKPVNEVSTAAARIASGDLSARLEPQTDPDLEQVVTSFNAMVDALQARIERDARFVSDVSHELRSPLMTLAASASVLERSSRDMPARQREAIQLIVDEIARFQEVVEELLELSRVEAGVDPLEVEPVRVGELLVNVTARYRSDPLVVEIDPSVGQEPVLLDKRRIERILVNLLDNARVHAGGAVRVAARRDDGHLVLEVDDEGPGIPPEERPRIFDRFYRGAASGRRSADSSAGLGLALVAEHVRLHGGSVRVESRNGARGSRFVVELPWRTA